MIVSWNGITGRDIVLDLLAYSPISPFEGILLEDIRECTANSILDAYSSIFEPLEEAVLDDGIIESKLSLLIFYRNLLDQWTALLLSQSYPLQSATSAVNALIQHANNLALTIVQDNLTVDHSSIVLDFYESTASLISQPSLKTTIRIIIPPTELIYTLQFTDSLCTISRLCAILALYKKAFEFVMAPKLSTASVPDQRSYSKEYVNHFNGFLMDICNCLWRSRAFNTSDPNALGCLISPNVSSTLSKYVSSLDTSLLLSTLFSFSYSPAFCLLAITYIRELEDKFEDEIELRHAGPVTQNSLKQLEKDGGLKLPFADYRLGILQYMENEGVEGVGELMYNTMKHLMNAREGKA